MFEAAARLQANSQETVKCISQLRAQRQKLAEKIESQQRARIVLEQEIDQMRLQLAALDQSLDQNRQKLHEHECKLAETEAGFSKVVDTMQILLMSVKRDEKQFKQDDGVAKRETS